MQDLGSQYIAALLNPSPDTLTIDACAGAGGKTLHLAQLMKNKGKIISMDVVGKKLKELEKRAIRNDISIVKTELISNSTISDYASTADFLLLDVPCSGIGVLKRNPDDKWKLSSSRIQELAQIQEDILTRYSIMLKPGGTMVYATCSILPVENEHQVNKFLQNHPSYQLQEQKTILPSDGGDGFFMAKLLKTN